MYHIDRSDVRDTVIDQHVAVRDVCHRHNDRRNEKQDFCLRIEPSIADRLRVRLACHPIRRQVINLDCWPGNAVWPFVCDENLWRQETRIAYVNSLLQGSERRHSRTIGHRPTTSIPTAIVGKSIAAVEVARPALAR